MSRILVVEDEPMVAEVVERYLRLDGHEVTIVFDGVAACDEFDRRMPDLIVLDLMLPRMDGITVFKRLREASKTPVIMLTARGDERDRLRGLDLGADDYVTKPFSPRELTSRVRAVLRRTSEQTARAEKLSFDGLQIDAVARSVEVDGRQVALTVREFDILFHLASHPRQVFAREQLLSSLWEDEFEGDASTVTVHVRRLRAKIEADASRPVHVRTVWGVGYKFEP
ncbi:MAG: response regulator transcription factor [Dehalococcoidia bacterium]|jgi:DNA-binding response OmpR family regulator|uniref:response regulator transcription factor n=1 Tax=Candidatus Amarobacter glycogenicus TaxID=3140699 RepID=UPI002A171A81|nr:response regulator transcription factor [Dehalococcoidia bacterium]MBK8561124.1 response regulator transcription factor [Dehalococcoidia bacterium]MBK9612414.1 response regulator transcription factor [Dehalococcoidia bacterium]